LLPKWSIRKKLLCVLALLFVVVFGLAWSAIHGLYAYRCMVRSLNKRVPELTLANDFSRVTGELRVLWYARRVSAIDAEGLAGDWLKSGKEAGLLLDDLRIKLAEVRKVFERYENRLSETASLDYGLPISDSRQEQETTLAIEATIAEIQRLAESKRWHVSRDQSERLTAELNRLQTLASRLPTFLHANIEEAMEEARDQYRQLFLVGWITSATTIGGIIALLALFYRWVFRPLRKLIKGSRRMAGGEFTYQIRLQTHDEMSELADNMNSMTAAFREINTELDQQVAERTRQVVRGEQLASVGFLAAGVAHEINNPLASIAVCAESLQDRVRPLLNADDPDHQVIATYLGMIEKEAFRCKEITEKLLDFSRTGEAQRSAADLRELVQDVVDMVRHVGKYQGKNLEVATGNPIYAVCNGREIKQVVLNLITNALDSLDDGGRVKIDFATRPGEAEVVVSDDGCGMTEEVRTHLFEPFFTRRRGGSGTGLGLSISYRIVADHHGRLSAHSEGPGRGSQFRLRLPVSPVTKEISHQPKAA
jgi:signal transduction histidine kinase